MDEQYKVIIPPSVPAEMHSAYLHAAIADAKARQKAEADRIQAKHDKRDQIAAQLEQVEEENTARREKEAKAEQRKAGEDFDAALRAAYFEANPGASESDWIRDKRDLRASAMKARALDQLDGRENEAAIMRDSLLKSGRYSRF